MTERRVGVPQTVAALGAALESIGVSWMVIGGVAVVARGVARLTDDVDATVIGADLDLEATITVLSRHGIIPRIDDAIRFARQSQVLLLRHALSDTPLDLSLAWLPFEVDAIERAERLDLNGVDAPVATVEDLLVYKAIAWRPRDREDIERLTSTEPTSCSLTGFRPGGVGLHTLTQVTLKTQRFFVLERTSMRETHGRFLPLSARLWG